MGLLTKVLAFPVSLPLGGVQWLAGKIEENARESLLDPGRIEAALMALEADLDAGRIDEDSFEQQEAVLLAELRELRAMRDAYASEAGDA